MSNRLKPKVYVVRNDFPSAEIDLLRSRFNVVFPKSNESFLNKQSLVEEARGSFGLFCYPCCIRIDKEVLDGIGPNLKVVSTCSVGYDHLDVEEIKRRGIRIGYTPDVLTEATAEMALTLLLATARRLPEANIALRNCEPWAPLWLCGNGLNKSTVGVVGLGRIGLSIAKKLISFNVSKLLYTSRNEKPEGAALGGILVDIDTLVSECDFVIVAVSLIPETKHIINRDRIFKMKKNAILVNIGRGGLVDQDALIEALQEKRIAGAGLDVTTPEPLPLDSPLLKMNNVVITPHIGSATYESRFAMSRVAVENIISVFEETPMTAEV